MKNSTPIFRHLGSSPDTTLVDSKTITSQRLSSQQLEQPALSVHDVVAHMGAMQAQDYYGALWSVGLRAGLTEAQVITAVESRQIVRTWPQRGTLHYVASEDTSWMTALSAPRLLHADRRRQEDLGLDETTLARSIELFGRALEGGVVFSRPQLLEVLETAGISTAGGRGYHMLWYAAQTGLIYVGPMLVKQQTFGLVKDLPVIQRKLSREESAAELAKRYFISHGPATLQDFMWWSGLISAEAKAGLAANLTLLRSEKYDGREYWLGKEVTPSLNVPKTLLLAGFDEYLLGYKDRTAQLQPKYFKYIVPGGNGMFMSTAVVGGQVVGVWKRSLKARSVTIEVDLFAAASHTVTAQLNEQGLKYGDFLGLETDMRWYVSAARSGLDK